jgi:hypothetical protein
MAEIFGIFFKNIFVSRNYGAVKAMEMIIYNVPIRNYSRLEES